MDHCQKNVAITINDTIQLSQAEEMLTEQVKKWWEMEAYALNCITSGCSKDDNKAIETLERSATFDGEPYEVGMLWNDNPRHLPDNFFSAMGQLKSLDARFEEESELEVRYEETIKTDHAKGFVRKLTTVEIESTTKCPQWYLPNHPVVNPQKPEKMRKICKTAAKYPGISLNDNLLPGPDLLNSLLGMIFRFRES